MSLVPLVSLTAAASLTFWEDNAFSQDDGKLNCQVAISEMLNSTGSLANHFLFSGKLFNNFGDVESCHTVSKGNYFLVSVQGQVREPKLFSRGGKGYYFHNMTSLIGFCLPNECGV